ncbi:Crp/Fnr family transcriptional regulator [Flavobacterium sp. MDT1-60]|uniref:Crp/Fnr family transcriptional regulator n=1 Tax=Flavobacterium sp. MDT1-60 TaxID=1979344 RepID=UPI00177CD4CB|nr:Crp/Fnr family transcriptional regulator [Flavobacterium sp. MDT1-60]QOG01816.1 Crp/Fnr family transcriptional regulator [Flavobacterium sp. MDT1-60]
MLTSIHNSYPKLGEVISNYKEFWFELNLPSKETVLKEGTVSNVLYFIIKGSMRLSNNDNGTEISIQFFFENDFVSSFESFLKDTPSVFSLDTIEDTSVLLIKKEHWKIIINENSCLKEMFIDFISDRLVNYVNHFLEYIKEKPEVRYQNLLKNKPYILQRVPLQYIASYLGITKVSLSRIRARKS